MTSSKKKANKATTKSSGSGDSASAGTSTAAANVHHDSPFALFKRVAFVWLALVVLGVAIYIARSQQDQHHYQHKSSGHSDSKSSTTTTKTTKTPASPPSIAPSGSPGSGTTSSNAKIEGRRITETTQTKSEPNLSQASIDESKTWSSPDPRIQTLWELVCGGVSNPTNNNGDDDGDRNLTTKSDGGSNHPSSSKTTDTDTTLRESATADATCHSALQIVGRSLRVTEPIPPDTVLLEIPRSMQIWDLDAYRDPFVRKYLFKASHTLSGNRLGTEAFLAAYVALEQHRAQENPSHFDPVRLSYLQSLPNHTELSSFHPVLQTKEVMIELLGSRSTSYSIVQAYRNMVQAEYDAFVAVSSQFQSMITKQQYFTARVNVMSRVVSVGVPGPEEVMPGTFIGDEFVDEDLLQDELSSYNDVLGIELNACIGLIPLADLLNHHPNPNTHYAYHPRSIIDVKNHPDDVELAEETVSTTKKKIGRSFVVSTTKKKGIEVYNEPIVSYGDFTDAHLFARYGFVNADGTGPTQISVGFNHEILRLNISTPSPTQQYDYVNTHGTTTATTKFRNFHLRGIAKYLHYDDGYEQCIPGPATHPTESELKRLKFEYLLNMANDYNRWNMIMPPRTLKAVTPASTSTMESAGIHGNSIPQYRRHIYHEIENEIERLQETCRFMTLINDDFDGHAVDVLKKKNSSSNKNNDRATSSSGTSVSSDFMVIGPNVSDALEFRSFMCISRWLGTRLVSMELHGSLQQQFNRLASLTTQLEQRQQRQKEGADKDDTDAGRQLVLNWTAQFVRFGEMDALSQASRLVFERVSQSWEDKKVDPEVEYTMKDDHCPEEFQSYLFRQEDTITSPDVFSLG